MAGDDDGEKDKVVFPFRRQGKEGNSQKESSQWSESCYGIWLKEKSGDGRSQESVCFGINIVHITKVSLICTCKTYSIGIVNDVTHHLLRIFSYKLN